MGIKLKRGFARGARGFTFAEAMLTVAIIGILASIAVANYTKQTQKSRRSDAKTALLKASQALEKCYTIKYNYDGCLGSTFNSDNGYYLVSVALTPSTSSTSYALTALAQGGQAADTHCAQFTLNSAGSRGATATDCW